MEFKKIEDIKDYEGLYKIKSDGTVISLRKWNGVTNRAMTQTPNSFGYLRVSLTNLNGKIKTHFVHKLVAEHFLNKENGFLQIRHLDGNKKNNCISNLAYGTALENAMDRNEHNKTARGERIGTSKLSNQDVINIRNSNLSQKDLSIKYNVSIANISMIINYKSRKNG